MESVKKCVAVEEKINKGVAKNAGIEKRQQIQMHQKNKVKNLKNKILKVTTHHSEILLGKGNQIYNKKTLMMKEH